MEAIILAGGLGTRLRGVIGEAPKCMAPVAGRPFLEYLFRYLENAGCTRCILSLGYRHEAVLSWLDTAPPVFTVAHVIEAEPLGTGGGIRLALSEAESDAVLVLNGDTLFSIDLNDFIQSHRSMGGDATLALKRLREFDRYGTVSVEGDGRITGFREKAPTASGTINGGIYCLSREAFLRRSFPMRFSFEKDYLENQVAEGTFRGKEYEDYFIDIGVPADYERAQTEVPALFSPGS